VIVTWWGSRVECDSSIARLEREGHLAAPEVAISLSRLDSLASNWQEIQPADVLRQTARRLLRSHPLRAADALQLASAILAAEGRPATLEFVCFDVRLSAAAQREGFRVLAGPAAP
jgi:hypothetical protein